MPWWCTGCGRRMGSPMCKKACREKWGMQGAERIPPLDGWVTFEVDPSRPESADMKERAAWFQAKREKVTAGGGEFWRRFEARRAKRRKTE